MTAAQTCDPSLHTAVLASEARGCVRRVLSELDGLVAEVAEVARTAAAMSEGGGSGRRDARVGNGRDALANTGVLWSACDRLIWLKEAGLPGLLARRCEEYRETLADAIEELREWRDDAEDADEGFSEGNETTCEEGEGEDVFGEEGFEKVVCGVAKLPEGRQDLRETLEAAVRRLRLVETMFRAVGKRRLRRVPAVSERERVGRVDGVMEGLGRVPEMADELASKFYDLDDGEARRVLQEICERAREVVGLVRVGWVDEEDEFTAWSGKWLEVLAKG